MLASCSTPRSTRPSLPPLPPPYQGPTSYPDWRASNADPVAAFEAYLRLEGVDELVPLPRLLRTSANWQTCHAAPFEVPPANQWRDVVDVLRLMQDLQALGVLGEFEVHSTYRNPSLNACVGGASRSAHALAWAVDFTPRQPADAQARICNYWREQGQARRMGLGRYPSGRLHVDTYGWRSWGPDGTWQTSLCPGAASARWAGTESPESASR